MVTTSRTGDKPVAHEAARRPTPTDDAEHLAACERMAAAARSSMMADARDIAARAAEFLGVLEAFGANHTVDSIADDVGHAGELAEYFRAVARHLLHDAAGLTWVVESFCSFFTSELLPEPAKPVRKSR